MATEEKKIDGEKVVLVGTFRPQNAEWIKARRLYNLPLPTPLSRSVGSRVPRDRALPFHRNISRIVLIAEGFPSAAYAAKFRKVVDGAWLAANGYMGEGRASARPHGEAYALYELGEKMSVAAVLSDPSADVYVASSRCPSVKIDAAFYDKPYPRTGGKSMPYIFDKLKPYFKKWHSATTFNPVQGDFLKMLMPETRTNVPFPPPKNPKFTFIDLFAGIGGFRLAMQKCGGECVFTSEFDPAAQKTYEANFGDMPFGDITKQETHDKIPEHFDVVCAGFPCQAFSLAGKRLGFKDLYKGMSRGTLFAELVKICERHHPKAVFISEVMALLGYS